jgi:dipeptide/tripeptide permease
LYVDSNLDTAELYMTIRNVFGGAVADFFSQDEDGTRRILGETIAHTGWIIMVLQVPVSWIFEKFRPIPSFLFGLFVSAIGFVVIALAAVEGAWLIFPGIMLFAVGEMISSPRIQEYITWLAPKEKAGLYMGSNFLAVSVGAFSGVLYTTLYGRFGDHGHPEYVWYVLAGHMIVAIGVFLGFQKLAGEFKTHEE